MVRDAFARAQARPRKKLTLVHKNNVLVYAGHLWTNGSSTRSAAEFPEVTTDYLHVDAATIFLVTQPERFDVIVTDNLFGDIITDLAAAVSGGIGVAASGNINPERRRSRRCSSRCTAPPRTSRARARPTRPPPSCPSPCCCDHLGYDAEAARIEDGRRRRPRRARRLPARTTAEIGDALAARVAG